jgi:hypothetical protein
MKPDFWLPDDSLGFWQASPAVVCRYFVQPLVYTANQSCVYG